MVPQINIQEEDPEAFANTTIEPTGSGGGLISSSHAVDSGDRALESGANKAPMQTIEASKPLDDEPPMFGSDPEAAAKEATVPLVAPDESASRARAPVDLFAEYDRKPLVD